MDQTEIKTEQDEANAHFEGSELKIEDLHNIIQGNESFNMNYDENTFATPKVEIKTESEILVMQQGNIVPVKIEIKEENFPQNLPSDNSSVQQHNYNPSVIKQVP